MATYYPRRAPGRRVYHRNWRRGYVVNSIYGALAAAAAAFGWIDNDFHLSKWGRVWLNAHGAPERFWLRRGQRFESIPWRVLAKRQRVVGRRVFKLRSAHQTLIDNHAHGLNTEFEVKDVKPWDTPVILDAAFARLARMARAVYGEDWQKRLVVKVLTNLSGGEAYALKVCRHAHAHGIPTMLLVRGKARFKRYAGHTEITWVRGSLVIR